MRSFVFRCLALIGVVFFMVPSVAEAAPDGWAPEYDPPPEMVGAVNEGEALIQRVWPNAEWTDMGPSEAVRYLMNRPGSVPEYRPGVGSVWNTPAGTARQRSCAWLVMYRGMMRVMARLAFRREDKLAFHAVARQISVTMDRTCRDPDDYRRAMDDWHRIVGRWGEHAEGIVRPGGLQRALADERAAIARLYQHQVARTMDAAMACVAVGGCPGAVQRPTAADAALAASAFPVGLVAAAVAVGVPLAELWPALLDATP